MPGGEPSFCGRVLRSSFFALVLGPAAVFGQSPYFPLETGNSWVYRVQEGPVRDTQTVEVLGAERREGRDYFRVKFFFRQVLLRSLEDGSLVEAAEGGERPWIAFGAAEGTRFESNVDECSRQGRIGSDKTAYQGPLGEFNNALEVRYELNCADAGITQQVFLPYIGLLRHELSTIAGPRRYELIYARVGRTEVDAGSVGFGIAVDRTEYAPEPNQRLEMLVRMNWHNSGRAAVPMTFASGQTYDLAIRNEAGETVFHWSSTRTFPAVFREERWETGERNFPEQVAINGPNSLNLPAGRYVVEGWLTTVGGKRYAAQVGFSVRR